jgi:hypothetical protein
MRRFANFIVGFVGLVVVSLSWEPAVASSFDGALATGFSENYFQISGASTLAINITDLGARDPSLCSSCVSGYTDNFSVKFFGGAGNLLSSTNATNSLWYSLFSSSHGIGAGPAWMSVPVGASRLEVVSQLSVFGLVGGGADFGTLIMSSDGSIGAAATPLPTALPLFAGGLSALGVLGWRRKRKRLAQPA